MARYYLGKDGTVTKKKNQTTYRKTENGTVVADRDDDDIAPVVTNKDGTKTEYIGWSDDEIKAIEAGKGKNKELFGGFLQEGTLSDGYQFGDVALGILGSVGDFGLSAVKGVGRMAEGVGDLGYYGISGVAGLVGADGAQKYFKEEAKRNYVDEYTAPVSDWINQYSVFGSKMDAIGEGVGQVAAIMLTGGAAGAASGSTAVATAVTTGLTGLSSTGSGMTEAYNEGATDGEALVFGLSKGAIDAGTELIFGGLGKGVKALGVSRGIGGLDDMFAKKVSSKVVKHIANPKVQRLLGNTIEYSIKAGGEGLEEVLAGAGSAVMKKLTYCSDEELSQLMADEDLLDQFIISAVVSSIAQGGDLYKSVKTDTDFVTDFTSTEEKVIDSVYQKEISEREASGEHLSKRDKSKLYDDVVKRAEKGYIDVDTIEEIVGGDSYTSYKKAYDENASLRKERDGLNNIKASDLTGKQSDRLAELKAMNLDDTSKTDGMKKQVSDDVFNFLASERKGQGSKLLESYREVERRGQAFTADLSQYKGKKREAIERAINSGVLNNTNRSHELVDILSNIEADKGIVFDYTNNQKLKETGFAIGGKTINGYVKDGAVTLNMQSQKAWESTVGHEITHVLEGTDAYGELQKALFKYAESRGELEVRRKELTELYKGIDADIDGELTAELIGDYLFKDKNFIKHISSNRNLFKRLYDEVKYLWNIATGKEKAQIEKVKHEFDKAWKEIGKGVKSEGVKYSVSETKDGRIVAVVDNDILSNIDTTTWDKAKKETAKKAASNALKQFSDGIVVNGVTRKVNKQSRKEYTRSNDTEKLYRKSPETFADKLRASDIADDIVVATTNWNRDGGLKHPRNDNFVDFDHGNTLIMSGNEKYSAEVVVGITQNGEAVLYDVIDMTPTTFEIKEVETPTTVTTQDAIDSIQEVSTDDSISPLPENVNTKFSLSTDSNGNELSLAVQKRFANSKAIDENGNLKVLYHGTASGEFYTFDKSKGNVEGDFGSGFYFTDSESDVEANYEDGGADFENKVARRAEQIEQEEDIDYSEAEAKAREELYKGGFKHSVYLNIENPAVVGETNLFDYETYAEEYDRNDYETDEDYEGDVEQLIADDIDQIIWDIEQNIDIYSTDGIADVLWNAVNEGGIGIEQLKAQINELYLEDNNGNLVGNEVTRQIIESLGYDGIIDNTVSTKFNMNLDEGTTHYIVFKPNQIKSIDNQNPTDNPDIRKSLSNKGEQPSAVGTPLNELYFEQDIAPIAEQAKKSNMPYGEYAPVSTEEIEAYKSEVESVLSGETPATAEEVEALNKEQFDSLTDEDVPPEVEQQVDYVPDSISVDIKSLKQLSSAIGEKLPLDNRSRKELEKVIQDFSTGKITTKEELYAEVKKRFDTYYYSERNEEIGQIKQQLRTIPVYVSDNIKGDFGRKADGYLDFMRKHFGKIRFSKEGVSVDRLYETLMNVYPGYFPDSIWNEAERLRRIAEVVDMQTTEYIPQTVDKRTLEDAADFIYDSVQEYKGTVRLTNALEMEKAPVDESLVPPVDEFDAPMLGKSEKVAESIETGVNNEPITPKSTRIADGTRGEELLVESLDNYPMKTVEQLVAEKIRSVEGELADKRDLRREAENDYNNKIANLRKQYEAKKDKSTLTAYNLLQSISRLEGLKARADADYAKRISDLEARLEKMNEPTFSTALQRREKMEKNAKWAENLIGDTSTWKDKKTGVEYAINTERRNLRDIVRDANGNADTARADAIYDSLMGEYNRNHAKLNRTDNAISQKYLDLNLSHEESVYADMLGELRHNPETTLTEKVVKEYFDKHSKKIDSKKVDAVIDYVRRDMDWFFDTLNKSLREQGMKEIPYRKGYFPHTTFAKQNFFLKLINWKVQDNEIPTSIAGLTEDFRPGKSYQSFDKQRHTDKTDYDILRKYEKYKDGALDWIYHLDDIQKRRAVENYIRYTHSDEGIQAKIKEVYANEVDDANEAQAKIEAILKEANNPLNNFVQDFTTHTNILAGKKNSFDRAIEQGTNRSIYTVMQNVQNRTSANMVLANIRSALTNIIPITQSWAQVSPLRSLQATKDTIANTIKDDGMINKSTFLTNRLREADNLYKTKWDKVLDKAGVMFEVVDSFSSQVIWRSKYAQNLSRGMSEADAIANADQFAENVMAGRSKGNEPTLFNAKNPLVKAFTMFQLEVNNQYGYFFKDVPTDLKAETNHWKFNLAKGLTTAFIGAYVYNALLSKVTGSDAALDPIGIIEELLRDLGLFDDDDEDKDVSEAFENFGSNVIEELPFIGGVLGGGRIPISTALPIKELVTGKDQYGNEKSRWETIKEAAPYYILPGGYGQIKKTVQGLGMFSDEHPVTGSYTDSGKLRFPVEDTPLNRVQAGLFGQYASENAREYFDNGYAPLGKKQIQEYQDVDLPIADYWNYREGMSGLKTNKEKAEYISSLDIADWQKTLLMNNQLDRKEDIDMSTYDDYSGWEEFDYAQKNPEKYDFFKSIGVSYSDYVNADDDGKDAYNWAYNNPEKYAFSKVVADDVITYRSYANALYDIKADKDANGKSISGSRKAKVVDYINNLDASYETKIILYKTEYPSDDTYNVEIIEYINARDDLTYDERVAIFTELGFVIKDGSVYW